MGPKGPQNELGRFGVLWGPRLQPEAPEEWGLELGVEFLDWSRISRLVIGFLDWRRVSVACRMSVTCSCMSVETEFPWRIGCLRHGY